ncbi:hypothetical protein EDC18_106134 [Natranaerovirga pectinivora]|uniref:Uncharacterized protein n=1 Tax=Natranaerovirga pectinivora TaxID=682400 RepID=A0A4R3MJU6_9FIRM|nr:hypothetical protein [Natranaerovirga pectinivora]TCT14336.1 hypothetical protein EDC18_106134 [Natranaerovirga pectinivora]
MQTRKRKKKTKIAYKRLIIVLCLFILIFSDLFNISISHWGANSIKSIATTKEPYYISVTVYQNNIMLNEQKVTFETLKTELSKADKTNAIIHLVDYGAYSNDLIEVHKYIADQGFRTIVSQRIPNITYEYIVGYQ